MTVMEKCQGVFSSSGWDARIHLGVRRGVDWSLIQSADVVESSVGARPLDGDHNGSRL